MPSSLQQELHKRNPFSSPEQEVYLSVLRTQSILEAQFEKLFKQHKLSQATYNALRILRGSGEGGRMCHEIGEHLVAQVPDVTRLIDRLENAGYATRTRSNEDRRVIFVRITQAGLDLLAKLDKPIADHHKVQLGHLSQDELSSLIVLLAKAREPHLPAE